MRHKKGSYPDPLDLKPLKTYSLFDRPSKVDISDFASPLRPGMCVRDLIDCLPSQLAAKDLLTLVKATCHAVSNDRPVMLAMGAHVIKVGLNPIIIDLLKKGIISSISMNGAGIIHDCETAMAGKTSEDVAAALKDGSFGAARETGEFINQAISEAADAGTGLGQGVGNALLKEDFPYNDLSILATCAKFDVPVTVHVAIGTDIIHIHPAVNGAAIGKTSHLDFRIFSALVSRLSGGVFLNAGSAVILPEVFLKALTLVRNLGYEVRDITTANFDFIRHYRPLTNVVHRPTLEGGTGFHFTGHHELMIPLFFAFVLNELEGMG